jgi:hypothetical protein
MPSPNISRRPTSINTTVAVDRNETIRKKAPMLPRNRAPEAIRIMRMIIRLARSRRDATLNQLF